MGGSGVRGRMRGGSVRVVRATCFGREGYTCRHRVRLRTTLLRGGGGVRVQTGIRGGSGSGGGGIGIGGAAIGGGMSWQRRAEQVVEFTVGGIGQIGRVGHIDHIWCIDHLSRTFMLPRRFGLVLVVR